VTEGAADCCFVDRFVRSFGIDDPDGWIAWVGCIDIECVIQLGFILDICED